MTADLILKNANIWTVDEALPHAEALAIAGNEIVFVGTNDDAEKLIGSNTRVLDLRGKLVLPGFNDCHTHFVNASLRFASGLDLYGIYDMQEIQARLKTFAQEHPGDWIYGMRWFPTRINNGVWPSRKDLDAVESNRPVVIFDIDGHSCWTNTAAIERKGYTAATPNPEGGEIVREADGYPSGVFFEVAQEQFERYPNISAEEFPEIFQKQVAKLNKLGITSISNNGIKPEYLDAVEKMDQQGTLHLRISEWPMILEDGLDKAVELRARFEGNEKIRVNTVKAFMDGVLSNYSAWMLDPVADKAGEVGYPVIDPAKLEPLVIEADRLGFQVATHVIGTRAVRTMLDMYEKAAKVNGKRDARHRLEHIETSHPDDRPRFKQLGVVASMTPVHCTADLEGYYMSRLGEQGHLGFAWKSFLDNGVHLSFGTDWVAVDLKEPSPLQQIFGAVTRCTPQNYGKLKWHLEQCISVQDSVRSYTLESAYAEKMEHRKGSITPGKLADVIVLSQNILETAPEKILETEVLMTIFDGKIVSGMESF
jgi:predicted amidohydrolase YtcJ